MSLAKITCLPFGNVFEVLTCRERFAYSVFVVKTHFMNVPVFELLLLRFVCLHCVELLRCSGGWAVFVCAIGSVP